MPASRLSTPGSTGPLSMQSTQADALVASAELETTAKVVLPLGTPEFSGVLDFTNVNVGVYVLTATMVYGDQKASQKLPLRVALEEGKKKVTVIESVAEQDKKTEPAGSAAATPGNSR